MPILVSEAIALHVVMGSWHRHLLEANVVNDVLVITICVDVIVGVLVIILVSIVLDLIIVGFLVLSSSSGPTSLYPTPTLLMIIASYLVAASFRSKSLRQTCC